MSSNVKIALVVSLIVVMPAMLLARSHQDVWVIEDFESYETTSGVEPMAADVVIQWPPTGGPWWDLYSLQDILAFIGSGGQAGGDGTPPFPTVISLGEGDPNGFLAFGKDGLEAVPDPNHPKCMILHYEMDVNGDVNLAIRSSDTGLPLTGPIGPLGLMATDLRQFDKMQLKIKLLSGSPDPLSAVTVTFATEQGAGPVSIGFYKAERADLPLGILGASKAGAAITDQDMWQLIEFDLSAILHSWEGSDEGSIKTLGVDIVAIIVGIEDEGETVTKDVTIAIDDIAFYKESDCPEYLVGDVSGDCQVTLADIAILAGQWLQ